MSNYRKTRRRFEHVSELRFLTFSCYQRLQLFNNDAIKLAFIEQLRATQIARPFELVAWVVMPEHVHLLIMPRLPDHPVDAVLKHLKGGFANTVLKRWRELEAPILSQLKDVRGKTHFWQMGGGYDRNVFSPEAYEVKFHYIHNNPVKRELVKVATEWPWSSARWYEGMEDGFDLNISPIAV